MVALRVNSSGARVLGCGLALMGLLGGVGTKDHSSILFDFFGHFVFYQYF